HKTHSYFTLTWVVGIQIKMQLVAVGNQFAVIGVDARVQYPWLGLVSHGCGLEERDSQLPRGDDGTRAAQNIHFHQGGVALALFVDLQHRNHDFLQGGSAMHEAAARALQTQAVDRLRDLYPALALQAKL